MATRGGNWFTRRLGMGYPELETIVAELQGRASAGGSS